MTTMTTAPMSQTQTPGKIGYKGDSYYKYPLLKRMQETILLEQYGQPYIVPANSTDVAKFRRYEALSSVPGELQEGVTPSGNTMPYTDYKVQLKQYGDFIELSDKLIATNEDRVMSAASDVLGEQASEMMEIVRFGVLCGGRGDVLCVPAFYGLYGRCGRLFKGYGCGTRGLSGKQWRRAQ